MTHESIGRSPKKLEASAFVAQELRPDVMLGKQRALVFEKFISSIGAPQKLATKNNKLFAQFDRIRSRGDLVQALEFVNWLHANVSRGYLDGKDLTYLADQNRPVSHITENMRRNFSYWGQVFGRGIFGQLPDGTPVESDIWKCELPLNGYYLSVKGGSGSGTFSLDIAIGYSEKPNSSNALAGQIWRVGIDLEALDSGEAALRIIRTGSGQKSQGDKAREVELKSIRDTFLDFYKTSPQRLLLFLALEMAYDLKFNTVKGLSTQGAMDLSLLSRSKNPPDYTASMTDVGFRYQEGNWHIINNLQQNFYDILAGHGYEEALRPHEVRGFDSVLKAFRGLKNQKGEQIPVQLLRDEPEEVGKAWDAHRRLHQQKLERKNGNGNGNGNGK